MIFQCYAMVYFVKDMLELTVPGKEFTPELPAYKVKPNEINHLKIFFIQIPCSFNNVFYF